MLRPVSARMRREGDLYALEAALERRGLGPVAGVDEAGRGACAGPLVVAAVVLPPGARPPELGDSKLLTAAARERVFERLSRGRASVSVVAYPPGEIDDRGVGVCNLEGMRRAVARLPVRSGYVLTDGFAVSGMPSASLGVIKGDRTAACVAAAGIVAKVTRDRLMEELHAGFPEYGFAEHKGYGTAAHAEALGRWGPSRAHRLSYANVAEHLPADRLAAVRGGPPRTIVGGAVEKEER